MSYDLDLFKPAKGETLEVATERFLAYESEEINPGPPDDQKENLKRLLASALIKKNPDLQMCHFRYEVIAVNENITEEEARVKYRHIVLNEPEARDGIQILLFDDSAAITVAYWHTGDEARAVF